MCIVLLIPEVKWSHYQPFQLSIFLSTTEHIVIQQIFVLKGDDEDDSEDENNTDNRTKSDGPSAKRQKTPS